jgi:ribosome-associated protein YbcJ (S4-like RNA binding protein)
VIKKRETVRWDVDSGGAIRSDDSKKRLGDHESKTECTIEARKSRQVRDGDLLQVPQ